MLVDKSYSPGAELVLYLHFILAGGGENILLHHAATQVMSKKKCLEAINLLACFQSSLPLFSYFKCQIFY